MLEKTVETYLVDRVRAAGGDAYKFSSPARVSVPDRIVVFPPARIYFVELKRPGGKPTRGQEREHERLRALGCDVRVIDSREAVDAFVREATAIRYCAPMVEQIIGAAMDCIRHDVAPDWQRAALRNRLKLILATSPVEQPAAVPIHSDMLAHIKWLHYCLREAGHCIDGGKCHHECGPKGECWRQDGCVPLTGSRLTDDWKLPAPSPADERAAQYLCTPKAGGEGYVINRAPDSFELRDCEIIALQADEKSAFALVRKAILAANRGGDIDVCSLIAADHILSVFGARASSANETGAEGALGYAQRLATGLWEKHWRDSAPQWKVLDDTLGVLTQIDNMVCGLSHSPAQADAREGLTDKPLPRPEAPRMPYEWRDTGPLELGDDA
ncbi:hypothetical protein U0E23_09955 [Burkholderia stagnalis]|uniref:hypothetical protein n=1 Tax=Burkholderia stagnalis TaxID=1503054 RepID=UPI002AB4A87D|nr:hypothetical protein [Burkholderia stagnalis]MDY7802789.1 hypothetical protein [Burkholderia stagnalis]